MQTLSLTLLGAMLLVAGIPAISADSSGCNDPTVEAFAMPSLKAANGDDATYYLFVRTPAAGGPALEFWQESNKVDGLQIDRTLCDGFTMLQADKKLDAPPLL